MLATVATLLNLTFSTAAPPFPSAIIRTATACDEAGEKQFGRKGDLPKGAAAALGFAMAEIGAPFQISDVIRPGPRLPFHRFVSATQTGCSLTVAYERGGRGYGHYNAVLQQSGGKWLLIKPQ